MSNTGFNAAGLKHRGFLVAISFIGGVFVAAILLPLIEIPQLRLEALKAYTSKLQSPGCLLASESQCIAYNVHEASGTTITESYLRIVNTPHNFTLPAYMRRRASVSLGDRVRLRNFVRKLASGESVEIGFLGGSISDSGGPNKGVSGDYVSDLSSYFRRVTSNVTIHQGGIPGILNLHFASCLELHIGPKADIIFIELAINDVMHQYKEGHGYHERLIRKALGYARRPATVELAFHTFQPEHLRRLRYLQTNADICGSVAEYYAQPMLAYRALLFDEVARGEMDPAAFMSRDLMHPDPVGHAYMVDAVVEMVRAEARALGSDEPWGPSDEAALERELAPPMFKNNDKISTGVVLLGEDMRRLVVENSTAGFDLRTVSPAFPHPATALHGQGQGSRLALDMRLDEVAAAAPIPFKAGWAFFGYLRDQSGQSRANVSCTNCYCPLYNLYPTQPGRFRQLFTSICMRSDPAGPLRVNLTLEDPTPEINDRLDILGICIAGSPIWP